MTTSPSEILSNVGSELRTPLNGVIGFAALLGSTSLTQEQREYLDQLILSAHSLLSQLNTLNDLSKLENHTLILEPSSVPLPEVIQEALSQSAPRAKEKQLQLHSQLDPAVPSRLRVDRKRFQQVILHLLDNAIKFTDQGAIHLRISLQSEFASTPSRLSRPQHPSLLVEVVDSGAGIPPELQNIVFDAFRRGHTTTTRRTGGIGLGLALSRKLIHLMGGEIGLESQPGQGSRFWFKLPLLLPDPANHETAQITAPPNSTPLSVPIPPSSRMDLPSATGKPRVLIIEDNSATARYLKQAISRIGCDTFVAHTPWEARNLLSQPSFDLILLDSELQGENGLVLAAEFRDAHRKRIPQLPPSSTATSRPPTVVAMAHDSLTDFECQRWGIHAFLVKPLDTSQLIQTISAHLTALSAELNRGI